MGWQIYLVIALIAAAIFFQYYISHLAKRALGMPAPDTSSVDGAALNMPRRMYYFYATHCRSCVAMIPILEKLCALHSNLIKINIDDSKVIALGFRIVGTPSFVLVENGIIREILLGTQTEKKLRTLLEA